MCEGVGMYVYIPCRRIGRAQTGILAENGVGLTSDQEVFYQKLLASCKAALYGKTDTQAGHRRRETQEELVGKE